MNSPKSNMGAAVICLAIIDCFAVHGNILMEQSFQIDSSMRFDEAVQTSLLLSPLTRECMEDETATNALFLRSSGEDVKNKTASISDAWNEIQTEWAELRAWRTNATNSTIDKTTLSSMEHEVYSAFEDWDIEHAANTNQDMLCWAISFHPRDPMPFVREIYERTRPNLNTHALDWHRSPLYEAVLDNEIDVVRYLVEQGADVNFEGDPWHDATYPIEGAARHDRLEIARFLLENGADVNITSVDESNAVTESVRHHHPEMLAFLLERGGMVATNSIKPTFKDAERSWWNPEVEKKKYLSCLRLLVEHGLPVNYPDGPKADLHTPLTWCVYRDYPECVEYLLSIGADPGIFLPDWPASKDPRGSAFAIARQFARTNCLEILERHQP